VTAKADDHAEERERVGDWGCTSSGRRYYPADPRPGDFDIEDIAHALSLQCRFGGHVRRHYSVAEHCVHVSYECCGKYTLDGLLHDASEAYLVDMPRPAKGAPGMEGYGRMEARLMAALIPQLRNFPRRRPVNVWETPACVAVADERMLATEARDLMPQDGPGGVKGWSLNHEPYPHLSVRRPWGHAKAKRRFLRRYRELTWQTTRWDRFVIAVRRLLGKDGCR